MKKNVKFGLLTVVALSVMLAAHLAAARNDDSARRAEIAKFNDHFTASVLKMDNAAIVAMWAEDGVSMLPGADAIEGRAAIQKMMDDVVARMPGYKVLKQEDDWSGLEISGDWASEWALTHQVVQPPDGKPAIEVFGKMLLVLHREADGSWKIKREAWTNRPAPKA